MCYPVWDGAYKRAIVAIQEKYCVAVAGFISRYLNGP